ncbi:MAG: MarR family transcriptional regulator [Chloroflexota bacterium]
MDRMQDLTSIDNATAYIIHRTARMLRVHLSRKIEELGLDITPEQWFILFRLYETPGMSIGALADKDLNDYPNISRQVEGLIKRGLAEREVDPTDRRRSPIQLTVQGRQHMERILESVAAFRAEVFQGISPTEIETFVAIMHRIQDNIRET